MDSGLFWFSHHIFDTNKVDLFNAPLNLVYREV